MAPDLQKNDLPIWNVPSVWYRQHVVRLYGLLLLTSLMVQVNTVLSLYSLP